LEKTFRREAQSAMSCVLNILQVSSMSQNLQRSAMRHALGAKQTELAIIEDYWRILD